VRRSDGQKLKGCRKEKRGKWKKKRGKRKEESEKWKEKSGKRKKGEAESSKQTLCSMRFALCHLINPRFNELTQYETGQH
jgi:hypothetical protein